MKSISLRLSLITLTAFIIFFSGHLRAEDTPQSPQTRKSGTENLEVVETESGIYYTVKNGDTLWDISQRFSDSPYLWPDLWSDNSQIANPHRIYPGERIRLFRRRDVERHAEPVTEEKPVEVAAQVVEAESQPEPELKSEPEPEPQIEPREELQPASRYYLYSGMDQVGFIREKAVNPVGVILKVQGTQKMISQDNIVYIGFEEDNPLIPGSRYTIYRTFDPIKDKKTGKYLGIQHYILGIAEIMRLEDEYAIGRVIRSYSNIRVDDLLMPYTRKTRKIAREKSQEGLFGEVIIAENHNLIIGDHTTVFINKGEEDGVRPGQTYSIIYQDQEGITPRRKKTQLKPITIGSLLVLHTEKTTATVYVTQAKRNIPPGAQIRTPFEPQ